MSTNTVYPHLTIDQDGKSRVGESGYKVIHLAAEHYHRGWTAEELLRQHSDLRPEEVYAALTYFYGHHDEMVAEMKKSLSDVEALRPDRQFSRDELLKRRVTQGT
jgi:uncharacterized protein (DUF433 family)